MKSIETRQLIQETQQITPVENQQNENIRDAEQIQPDLAMTQQIENTKAKQIQDDRKKADIIRKELGIPAQEAEISGQMTPEEARIAKWYSSNASHGEKKTPDGEKIYGLSLTTNPDYAQAYSKTKEVNVFDLSAAKLKTVSFDYGMTIDDAKRAEIISEGFDGIIFDGMGGPEVALLTNVAKLEGQITPIPKGIQSLIDSRRPISPTAVAEYGIKLPEGYVLEDERFIFKS